MNRKYEHPIIVALDNVELDNQTVALLRELSGKVWGFKITDLHDRNPGAIDFVGKFGNVMADMKIHDIPSTAANRVRALAQQGASIITVHASGGHEMTKACVDAVEPSNCQIAPVFALTSTEFNHRTKEQIITNIHNWNLSYPREQYIIIPHCGIGVIPVIKDESRFTVICPGIRPAMYTKKDDQKQTTTPGNAMREGADLLVIGRPIMESPDPVGAVAAIMAEVNAATTWEEDKE